MGERETAASEDRVWKTEDVLAQRMSAAVWSATRVTQEDYTDVCCEIVHPVSRVLQVCVLDYPRARFLVSRIGGGTGDEYLRS